MKECLECKEVYEPTNNRAKYCPTCSPLKRKERQKEYRLENKQKISDLQRQHYIKNRDNILAQQREYYVENVGKISTYNKRHYLVNKDNISIQHREYYLLNKDTISARQKGYSLRDDVKVMKAYTRKLRESSKIQATPAWFDKEEVKMIYTIAQEKGLEVDHMVPLRSGLVCGLHVQDNLRCIPAALNRHKGNRYWPDMPKEITV